MNASDLSCTENLSANVGKRGPRGIKGITGLPQIHGGVGPNGLQGPSGGSRIDISLQGEEQPYLDFRSERYSKISYMIYPGSTAWGADLSKIKIATAFNKNKVVVGTTMKVTFRVQDITNPLAPAELLSAPLVYSEIATAANLGNTEYNIVQNGDSQNLYTTLANIPTTEALIMVTAKLEYTIPSGVKSKYKPRINLYAIELY